MRRSCGFAQKGDDGRMAGQMAKAQGKSKVDIWRTASALVTEHGLDAGFVAGLRADALLAQYNVDGHLLWKRIKKAVRELQRDKPIAGEWIN